MCTSLVLKSAQHDNFFSRTMDFSYDIEPGIYVIPKDHFWCNVLTKKNYYDCYSFIAIGQESNGMLGFFDGVNENGFAAAALYFEGYANYDNLDANETYEPIPSVDFLHYILGMCASVDDLSKIIKGIRIIGIEDPVTKKAAPLHWIATDRSGKCVVIEQTQIGLEILDNPIGVMANSPDLRWHMTNLRNYIEISQVQKEMAVWGGVPLKPFGQGGGTRLLPGGYTSPERFVRTAYLKTHCKTPENDVEAIMSCLHILGNVSIPEGIVLTNKGTYDYTKYAAVINTRTCEYYFKTHRNGQVATVGLKDAYSKGTDPVFLGKLERPVKFERF